MFVSTRDYEKQIAEGWLKIYFDDFLIAAENSKQLEDRTLEVLQRSEEGDFYFKPEKCIFDVPEIEFCGMIVGENRVMCDPVKLKGIADWPAPKSLREL